MPSPRDRLPSALEAASRRGRLGRSKIPALLVHPRWEGGEPAPVLLWMHGRTARKETDPGRYLRLLRAGIGVCAVDLPGHGQRHDPALQDPPRTLEIVLRMIEEIDEVVEAVASLGVYDRRRMAIGGMSAGGMAALARLCRPHPFRCAAVEATTGSWEHQRHREMFRGRDEASIAGLDPVRNLERWREIPLQAIHCVLDRYVAFQGQAAFLAALRERYRRPELIEFVVYQETGAPFEHAGFGRLAADAKDRQRGFLQRRLAGPEG